MVSWVIIIPWTGAAVCFSHFIQYCSSTLFPYEFQLVTVNLVLSQLIIRAFSPAAVDKKKFLLSQWGQLCVVG